MKHLYIDSEFGSIRENGRFQQVIIAIGAVLVDDQGKEIDTFYSLICPRNFKRLGKTVQDMTKLDNQMIRNAPTFYYVYKKMLLWIHKNSDNEEVQVYSFGPDDQRTLKADVEHHHLDLDIFQKPFVDLQKIISKEIKYNEEVIAPVLSLENLKLAYQVQGEVEHHALSDARDLFKLHLAYKNNAALNEEHIKMLYDAKLEKARIQEERRKERMKMMLEDVFTNYQEKPLCLKYTRGLQDLLRRLKERDGNLGLGIGQNRIRLNQTWFWVNETNIYISFQLKDTYTYTMELESKLIKQKQCVVLTYQNANPLYSIIKYAKKFENE